MELLIVVLIIGILSAMALPKYRRAVERARASEAVIHMATYMRLMDVYILGNGFKTVQKAALLKDLDVDIPESTNGIRRDMYCYQNNYCYITVYDYDNYEWRLSAYRYQNSYNSRWLKYCSYSSSGGQAVCKGLEADGYNISGHVSW